MVTTSRHILAVLGILSLLVIVVLLSEGQTTRQRFRWLQRRLIRKRPTRPPPGHVKIGNSPSDSVKSRPKSQSQDFNNANDVDEYWTDLYDNGDISNPYEPGL